ncbi:MAG: HesA/MoeB/ThiF family protein [Planctomycetaceae bacterium]|nr:HesA/MoeB/ThiF family protein [Planctomycetaceae bacterium]
MSPSSTKRLPNPRTRRPLTAEERAVYEWQLGVAGFGEEGQKALKSASVLISRVGGVGGAAATALAAAGIGRLVLAHHGNVRSSDLNRQTLMTADGVGKPRVESALRRLKELNPRVAIEIHNANVGEDNVDSLVAAADLVIDAAPLFRERFLLNRAAVEQGKPMVDSAMYELEAQLTTFLPGQGPCLTCLVPGDPPGWRRQFPVFGAVSTMIGSLAAMEAIKVLSGVGEPLVGRLLLADLRDMSFRTMRVQKDPNCLVCRDQS